MRLTVADSVPGPDGLAVVAWTWTLEARPPQSTVVLDTPAQQATGFTFADGVRGLDRAGAYVVSATVVDAAGVESRNPCELRLQAIPSEALLLQLSWAESTGDIDLTNGAFSLVSGIDAIRQNIQIRCQFILGEWFLNRLEGIPFFTEILGTRNKELVWRYVNTSEKADRHMMGVQLLNKSGAPLPGDVNR